MIDAPTLKKLRAECSSFRCYGGWPGGVHEYVENGRTVRCPVCSGTGYNLFDLERAGLRHVPALLDALDRARDLARELLEIAWRRGRGEFPPADSDRLADIEVEMDR